MVFFFSVGGDIFGKEKEKKGKESYLLGGVFNRTETFVKRMSGAGREGGCGVKIKFCFG